jgi:hypothetical protein
MVQRQDGSRLGFISAFRIHFYARSGCMPVVDTSIHAELALLLFLGFFHNEQYEAVDLIPLIDLAYFAAYLNACNTPIAAGV